MIPLTAIVQGIIDRIQTCLPVQMKNAVMRFPDKPEQFTPDILRKSYPYGALMVKHLESGAEGGAEVVFIGVAIVAETSVREEKLAEAVRGYINRHQIAGLTKYEFATDKPLEIELGIICRTVAFKCYRPAVPAGNIEEFNKTLNI